MSADRVDVRYVLDEAEIPTFQQRGRPTPSCSRASGRGAAAPDAHRRRPPASRSGPPAGRRSPSARAGRPRDDARRDPARGGGRATRARRRARRDVRGPRRLEGDRRAAGPRHGRARERAGRRSDARAPALPAGPARQPGRHPRGAASPCARAPARCRRPTARGGRRRRTRERADDGLTKVFGDAAAGQRRARAAAAGRLRLGRRPRALARVTARPWWPRTSSARAGRRARRSRSARS